MNKALANIVAGGVDRLFSRCFPAESDAFPRSCHIYAGGAGSLGRLESRQRGWRGTGSATGFCLPSAYLPLAFFLPSACFLPSAWEPFFMYFWDTKMLVAARKLFWSEGGEASKKDISGKRKVTGGWAGHLALYLLKVFSFEVCDCGGSRTTGGQGHERKPWDDLAV